MPRRRSSGLALLPLAVAAASCGNDESAAADAAAAADAPVPDAPSPADAGPRPDAAPTPDAAPGSGCVVPIELAPGDSHAGDTNDAQDGYSASCSSVTSIAPDTVYRVALGEEPIDLLARVVVDEEADPPYDAVLSARASCPSADSELACADVGYGDRLEVLAESGDVFLFVDGTNQFGGTWQGAYQLETSARSISAEGEGCDPDGLASRCQSGFRCSGGSCVADSPELACSEATELTSSLAEVSSTTFLYASDFFQGSCAFDPDASFAEDIYRIEVTAPSDLDATTDFPETDFDTYLYLREAACDGAELACHDDVDVENFNLASHITAEGLEPGTYFLFVDGSSDSPGAGSYRLQVTLTPP